MKSFLFALLLSTIIFSSCDKRNKELQTRLTGADSVAINYFKGDGRMDSVVSVKIIRDKQQMDQLADFISASPAKDDNCGYDGSLHFFKNNMVLQDADFRMNDVQCMHFRLKVNGAYIATALSAEAKQLLESLRK